MKRKLTGCLLAWIFVLCAAFCALADENAGTTSAGVTSISLTKILNKQKAAAAPNTSFRFSVVPDESADGDVDMGKNAVKNGVTGGVTVEGDVAFSAALSDEGEASLTGSTRLVMHPEVYSVVGIYRYVLTEVNDAHEGIAYDDRAIYLDVYVQRVKESDASSALMVSDVVAFVKWTNDAGAEQRTKVGGTIMENKGVSFTNTMSDLSGNDQECVQSLTVQNTVTGNQGDLTKEFSYTILIHGNNDQTGDGAVKEQYLLAGPDNLRKLITSGESVTIGLKDSQSVTIYGLSVSDTFQVQQKKETGYTTTVYVARNKLDDPLDTGSQSMVQDGEFADVTVDYTNNNQVVTPTGIAFTYGPYVLMIAFAGILLGLYVRSRNREDF